MQVRFVLGPAGSGKTYRCLAEIRAALGRAADGPPLLLLAPKQATFQLERQLLADGSISGYSRLRILSFERLAGFIFEQLDQRPPPLLSEEGRVMVLRALLTARKSALKIFRASARLPGFARQLSGVLRELQQYHLGPARLQALADQVGAAHRLNDKLHDLGLLLRAYLDWLEAHQLQDADCLLDLAAETLRRRTVAAPPDAASLPLASGAWPLQIESLWLDGFAQMTPQERRLLVSVLPYCAEATLAFCLDAEPRSELPWYSPWALLAQTVRQCRTELSALPGTRVSVEILAREPGQSRFALNPVLQHLEQHWPDPVPMTSPSGQEQTIRVVACAHPEGEAMVAARAILRYVRDGGRFREVAVLVRQLEVYHDAIRRVFTRYGIPLFLDRRENVAHHPLAELTRSALRTVAFHWRHDDWFGALKSGLVNAAAEEIDWLENEALAHGWEGSAWLSNLRWEDSPAAGRELNRLRGQLIAPFQQLSRAIGAAPSGRQLAGAIRQFWENLEVSRILQQWSLPEKGDGGAGHQAHPIHATVWDQMQEWLDNLAMAFPTETMGLADWLPILEAGLAGLTVGVIPPVLDQVLVGSIDRSRNPDLKRIMVLGLNETVFPAPPPVPLLLSESDRRSLEEAGSPLGPGPRLQLGHERFYGYIACTRARDQVILTYAQRDQQGQALNPSTFIKRLQRLFPWLDSVACPALLDWPEAEHACELIGPLLKNRAQPAAERDASLTALEGEAVIVPVLEQLSHLHTAQQVVGLSPELAAALYGPVLRTSVSRLERFAHCPFRFFVDSGLRVEERKKFELDVRRQGSFQHEVLARFHQEVRGVNRRWRDLTVGQAQERIGRVADEVAREFEQGMLQATGQNQFLARSYRASLQQFIAAIIGWMSQYEFDPEQVEIGFGLGDELLPAWELPLDEGRKMSLAGRIDRVDLWRSPGADEAWCVVIDYKSGLRKLDPVFVAHGIQQQLPAYLNLLRHLKNTQAVFGVPRLIPGAVFYVPLRGRYEAGANRAEVLARKTDADKLAYSHQGIFDLGILRQLDNRPAVSQGDQFPYRLKKDGAPYANNFCGLETARFRALLDGQEKLLAQIGNRIYAGDVQIDPWKRGRDSACGVCEFQSICRIDPWTHRYRVLEKEEGRMKNEE
jgi:ATP-dependent helicase/nuclease subunit B